MAFKDTRYTSVKSMAESFVPTFRKPSLDVSVHLGEYFQKDTQSGLSPYRAHPTEQNKGKHLATELPAHTMITNSARPFLCLAKQATSRVRVRTSSCCPLLLINDSDFHALNKEFERGTHNRIYGCHSIKLYT